MSRVQTTKRKKTERPREWPSVVYLWIFGMIFFGYVVGRIALNAFPHPYHWLSALIGGIFGAGLALVLETRGYYLEIINIELSPIFIRVQSA